MDGSRPRSPHASDPRPERSAQQDRQRSADPALCRHWVRVTAQAKQLRRAKGRIFPYNSRSVGTAFRRACVEVSIKDLHFHDLRHEGTSRLFEAGFAIEQVALVTGHKEWKMLRRYTHIRPEALHGLAAARAPFPSVSLAAE
ncbi:MAG: tyrosine-type recombinase/integrase [Roseobacter sp.]